MTGAGWLGPTYAFTSGEWQIVAGVRADSGRVEWLLTRNEGGDETVSHTFMLEPHATADDLVDALGDLPPEIVDDLVAKVDAQRDPQLLSSGEGADSLA
jgi:hypothetical protein